MRCDALHTEALARQSGLDEALLKLGRFEEAYSDFKGWLTRAHNQLHNPESIPGQSASVAVLATKHKVNLTSFYITHMFMAVEGGLSGSIRTCTCNTMLQASHIFT